jgi:hypothetical protein
MICGVRDIAGWIVLLTAAMQPLFAQSAQVTGLVTDQTGGVIPGTSVVLINLETGARRKSASNAEGLYAIPLLQPGRYQLSALKEGFLPYIRDNITLRVGDRVSLNLVLVVGTPTTTITVSVEVPLLRTGDAQTGLVIDSRRIRQLPQYDRNPLALAQLSANATGKDSVAGHDSDFRINGGRTGGAEYILDGVPVTTGYLHKVAGSVPSMEAIAEFKVVTGGLPAEYGRLSGGVVLVGTKAGTRQFHGSAFEFLRNDKLNANAWDSNRRGRPRGVFHDNIFGGSLGGPLRIPRLAGEQKTFFFASFEGLRNSAGTNAQLASVPTETERQGDFSRSLYNGRPAQIFDWTTGRLDGGRLLRQPFPGNRIPASRFDPLAGIYLGFYPLPNQAPQAGTSGTNNFIYRSARRYGSERWTGRLDQNWSPAHSTHFTLHRFEDDHGAPQTFSLLQETGDNRSQATTASLEHVWTLGVATVLTARAGVVRLLEWSGTTVDRSVDSSRWPLQDLARNLLGGGIGRTPKIYMDWGPAPLGGGGGSDTRESNYYSSLELQRLSGRHSWKAGFDHRRYYLNQMTGGSFAMSTSPMVTAASPGDLNNSGHPFASFLLGQPTWGSGTQYAGPASLQTYWGAYVQDDIKLARMLSVNLGVRWDFEPSRTERFDRQIFWDTDYRWPWEPNAGWSWNDVKQQIGVAGMPDPAWLTAGIRGRAAMMGTREYPGRTLLRNHPFHFSPHAAVAWQLGPHTALRASYGINWLTVTGNQHINYAIWNAGFGDYARLPQDGSGDGGLTYLNSFVTPMPGGEGYVRFSRDIDYLNRQVMGNWWLSETSRFSQGHEHDIQLSLQREIGSGKNAWVAEIAFSGLYSRDLPFWIGMGEHVLPDAYHKIGWLGKRLLTSVENPFYGRIPANSSRGGRTVALGNLYQLNPLWQQISTTGDPLGTANYTAGYVQVEHRFGGGFSLLANYTLSKLMQDTGAIDQAFTQGFPQAGLGPADVYGIAHTDQRHKLVVNYSLDLPVGRGRRLLNAPQSMFARLADAAAGGWSVAGTTLVRGGTPLSVEGTDRLWWDAGHAGNGASERPVWVNRDYNPGADAHRALEGSAGYTPYLNLGAFRKARALENLLEIGDVGTVIPMRGPGFIQWDVALLKDFRLNKEGRILQLRAEIENLLNKMNPGNPGNQINDPVSFGKITTQSGSPRRIMLAARLQF